MPNIIRYFTRGKATYPPAIHIHAAAFVGWLALLTVQITFIRRGRYDLHRRLGVFGGALAVAQAG